MAGRQVRNFFLHLLKFVVGWTNGQSIDFTLKITTGLQFNESNLVHVSKITSYKLFHQISPLLLRLTGSKIIPLWDFNHVHFNWTGEVQQPSQADPLDSWRTGSGDVMTLGDLSAPPTCLRLDSFSATFPAASALLLQNQVTQELKTASGSLKQLHRERDQQEQGGLRSQTCEVAF